MLGMNNIPENTTVIWQPIANSSQELAIDARCHHTLYCGTRGPGKTLTQLMRFRRYVGIGYGQYWRGIIFDLEYKNLGDVIAQSKRFFYQFNDGAKFLESASQCKWVWPTGEELLFRHAKKLTDYERFHGHEYPFIGWNELTKWASRALYDKIMSTNRTSFTPSLHTPIHMTKRGRKFVQEKDKYGNIVYDTVDGRPLPPIPLQVFSTTNSSGPGHGWVKRDFINVAPYGEIVKVTVPVFNPQTQQDEEVTRTQVTIFGSYRENIYLPPAYIAELDLSTQDNPNLKASWLEGSWDVTAGGALDDLWNSKLHVLQKFKIPKGWKIDRSFDWGSSHPFSVCWWAEANGEDAILPDGKVFNPPVGTLIQIGELYGSAKIGTNKGVMWSATEVARKIKAYERDVLSSWINGPILSGPADNQIRDVREVDVDTIETKMSNVGVRWDRSDKSPGSRKIGLELIRERLGAVVHNHRHIPHLYFMQHCKASIELLPPIPRDPDNLDDVDSTSEDHIYDAVRYRVLKGRNRFAHSISVKQPV